MRLRWLVVGIIAGIIIIAVILYEAYTLDLIDMKEFMTWVMADVVVGFLAGIIGYLLGRKAKPEPNAEELAKAIAEESQKLKEKEEAIKKHTDLIYNEVIELISNSSDFGVQRFSDWLFAPNPNEFPKELSSHLEAYNALRIAKNAMELCEGFNADLRRTIDETIKEFAELVEKLAEKERAEGKKFSLQRYDVIPRPDRFYFPKFLAWNIYHDVGIFQPYKIEPVQGRDGWYKIGNTVAQTDDKAELESFTNFVNAYCLRKIEVFKKFPDRGREATDKIKEFFNALKEIKKKLNSGHRLEGRCYLCPDP